MTLSIVFLPFLIFSMFSIITSIKIGMSCDQIPGQLYSQMLGSSILGGTATLVLRWLIYVISAEIMLATQDEVEDSPYHSRAQWATRTGKDPDSRALHFIFMLGCLILIGCESFSVIINILLFSHDHIHLSKAVKPCSVISSIFLTVVGLVALVSFSLELGWMMWICLCNKPCSLGRGHANARQEYKPLSLERYLGEKGRRISKRLGFRERSTYGGAFQ